MGRGNKQQRSWLERIVGKIADKDRPLVLRSFIRIAYILGIGAAIGFALDNLNPADIWRWAMTMWTGMGM